MRKLDMENVSKLPTANDMLDEKYGKFGDLKSSKKKGIRSIASRNFANVKPKAWFAMPKAKLPTAIVKSFLTQTIEDFYKFSRLQIPSWGSHIVTLLKSTKIV